MRNRLFAVALAVAVVGATLVLWGFVFEPSSLRRQDYELTLPRWSAACDGIRVAVLTDLHVGSPFNGKDKLERILRMTQEAKPDLVLLVGDYVITGIKGGHFVPPEEIAPMLRQLSAPLGVFAVLGNHDRWYDGPRVQRALEDAGIPVLEDAARQVDHGLCRFWLVGVGDYWTTRHDVRRALSEVHDSLLPVLLFTHNPDLFPEIPERVALTIAGHTHGGQVAIPFYGRPIVPSRYGERYAIGHVVEGGRHLFVSTGLGTSIIPVRFRVAPEVSVVTLRSAAPERAPGSDARTEREWEEDRP